MKWPEIDASTCFGSAFVHLTLGLRLFMDSYAVALHVGLIFFEITVQWDFAERPPLGSEASRG